MGIPRFTPARCPHLSSERTFQRGTQFRKTFVRMFVRNDLGHVCPYGFTKSWLEHDFRVWRCVTSSSWPYSRARLAIVVVSIFCRGSSIPLDALFRFVSPPPTPPPSRRSSGVFRSVSVCGCSASSTFLHSLPIHFMLFLYPCASLYVCAILFPAQRFDHTKI